MKIKIFYSLIAIILALSLTSCPDKSPVDADTDFTQYLPLIINNSWKYDVFETDTTGKRIANTDSYTVKVLETLIYQNKNAVKIDDDGAIEYLSIEGSKLYRWGSFGDDMPDQWILMADLKGSKWTLIELPVVIDYNEMPIEGTMKVTVAKGKKETKTVKGKQVECIEFIVEITVQGNGYLDEVKVPVTFKKKIREWYGKNIGKVLSVNEPEEISMMEMTFKMSGEEHELIDYTLK